jgi:hypothetical protein
MVWIGKPIDGMLAVKIIDLFTMLTPSQVALIGLYVQSYFCWRLYAISKKWWIVTPIASLFLFAVLAIVIAVSSSLNRSQCASYPVVRHIISPR